MAVDITALRPINVEDLTGGTPRGNPLTLGEHVAAVSGSAAGKKNENLRNVGPSVEYRLVDQAGQAHEFMNYMLPVQLDGARSEEHPSELQSPMRNSYAVFCLKKTNKNYHQLPNQLR